MNEYNIKTLMTAISIIVIQFLMYVYIIHTDISNDCARIFLGLFYVLFFVLPVFIWGNRGYNSKYREK